MALIRIFEPIVGEVEKLVSNQAMQVKIERLKEGKAGSVKVGCKS